MVNRNMPGTNHHQRFVEVQYAKNIKTTVKRIAKYFIHEKLMVICMLIVVIFGTLCGIYAPSLQSNVIDIIAGSVTGNFNNMLFFMFIVYMFYSGSQLLQGFLSAKISQRVIKRMREELFSKIIDLPVYYLDTNSYGDIMSRMTNDIENISTTISQSLPSLFSGVLTIIGTVGIMFWYCWQLALLSCVTVLLTLLVTKVLSGKVRKFMKKTGVTW